MTVLTVLLTHLFEPIICLIIMFLSCLLITIERWNPYESTLKLYLHVTNVVSKLWSQTHIDHFVLYSRNVPICPNKSISMCFNMRTNVITSSLCRILLMSRYSLLISHKNSCHYVKQDPCHIAVFISALNRRCVCGTAFPPAALEEQLCARASVLHF